MYIILFCIHVLIVTAIYKINICKCLLILILLYFRTFSHPLKFANVSEILGTDANDENQTAKPSAEQINNNNQTNDIELAETNRREQKKTKFKNLLQRSKDADSFRICNLRLLPNCRNPLHVMDTATQRYYLGIIDFFTLYECKQRTARVLKTVKYCTFNHSTVPPDKYGQRFYEFIKKRTE